MKVVETAAVIYQQRQNQGSWQRKRAVFGVWIGLGGGGMVVARGWVFTMFVAGRWRYGRGQESGA